MAHETATIFDCVGHLLGVGVPARELSARRANLPKVGEQVASRLINELHHIGAIAGHRLLHRIWCSSLIGRLAACTPTFARLARRPDASRARTPTSNKCPTQSSIVAVSWAILKSDDW